MRVLIVFDSVFGNTGKVAHTIGETIATSLVTQGQVETLLVGDVTADQLPSVDLLVVGSPTRSLRPTEAVSNFLKSLPRNHLSGVLVAAFDTRFCLEKIDSSVLRFIVDKGGYAASWIAKIMQKKGGKLVAAPEGFLVTGEEGPLKDGELERCKKWADQIFQDCRVRVT